MTELQNKLLDSLKWLDDFCAVHQLRYFAVGGTMLGAVRHRGFIPWDDDLDVGMPRPDYEKFCRVSPREGSGNRFVVETVFDGRPDYLYPHAKVYDTSTTLIEHKRCEIRRGLFIDVFPIDGVGQTEDEAWRFFQPIARRLDFLATRVCGLRKGRSFLKNAAVAAAGLIPSGLYDNTKKMQEIDLDCRKYKYEESRYAANFYGIKRRREIMLRAYFGEPKPYEFEGMTIMGVEKPDEYLTQLFGDWRRLPPKDQQVTHHDFVRCDLNKSYLTDG